MLNRRILRTKAFKTIYSCFENPEMTVNDAESLLELSCESVRDLYLFLLSVVGPLTSESRARIEAARSKFNPSEAERNPNMKFVGNRIATILENDPDFKKIIHRKKLSWDQYDVFLRHLYESVRERQYFQDYLSSGEDSLKADAGLWVKIFETEFEDNAELSDILEDISIYWNDDLGYALSWCCRSMKALGSGKSWSLPPLYQSELPGNEKYDSDKKFVTSLLRNAYSNLESYCEQVASLTPKWNRDRICATDLMLIVCGMAEADCSNGVSCKVIINEYVEISKYYSTPESSGFVNGLLDKLINKKQ